MSMNFHCARCQENQNFLSESISSSYYFVNDGPKLRVLSEKELSKNDKVNLCESCTRKLTKKSLKERNKYLKENAILKKALQDLVDGNNNNNNNKMDSGDGLGEKGEKVDSYTLSELDMKIMYMELELKKLSITKKGLLKKKEQLSNLKESYKKDEETYWKTFLGTEQMAKINFENQISLRRYEEFLKNETKRIKDSHYRFFIISGDKNQIFTINGLRLGMLESQPVDWKEINAALGLCVLMMYIMCKQVNYEIPNYQLKPMASKSEIRDEGSGETFHLYYSKNNIQTFNLGLTSFLNCIQLFNEYLKKALIRKKEIELPEIKGSVIDQYDVRYKENSNKKDMLVWTKAMKRILMILNYFQKLIIQNQRKR